MMKSDVVMNENSILLIIKRYLGFLLVDKDEISDNDEINAKFIFQDMSENKKQDSAYNKKRYIITRYGFAGQEDQLLV